METGLASTEWHHFEVSRKDMKALMKRSDQPAIRDAIILFGCMIVYAGLGIALWPSWWSVPFRLAYGVLHGSAADSRWHECGHGHAYKTPWMNNLIYQIASFMIVCNPVTWRWSHFRHHTDTIIVGRDPEIVAMRPPHFARILSNLVGLADGWNGWTRMLLNASGKLDPAEKTFIPETDQPRVVAVARIWTLIYAATIGLPRSRRSALWPPKAFPLSAMSAWCRQRPPGPAGSRRSARPRIARCRCGAT